MKIYFNRLCTLCHFLFQTTQIISYVIFWTLQYEIWTLHFSVWNTRMCQLNYKTIGGSPNKFKQMVSLHLGGIWYEELTYLLASRFLEMWWLRSWMPKNVTIFMFDLIKNLLRFLEIWYSHIWFISRNLIRIIYSCSNVHRFINTILLFLITFLVSSKY